jgi:hypothetical protein
METIGFAWLKEQQARALSPGPTRIIGPGTAGCLDLLCQFKAYHRKQINRGWLIHFDGNNQSIFDHAAKFTEVLF